MRRCEALSICAYPTHSRAARCTRPGERPGVSRPMDVRSFVGKLAKKSPDRLTPAARREGPQYRCECQGPSCKKIPAPARQSWRPIADSEIDGQAKPVF